MANFHLLTSPHDLDKRYTSEQMIAYCKESRKCRQQLYIKIFLRVNFYQKDVCVVMCVSVLVNVVNVTKT